MAQSRFKIFCNFTSTFILLKHKSSISFYVNQAFPLFYILMTRKTEAAYTHVFQNIENTLFKLEPTSVMSDYERALRNALRTVYPNAQIIGCWFHFCQAVGKHCKKISGLKAKLDSDFGANKLYHKFLTLPLIRLDLITGAIALLVAESLQFGPEFATFVAYFQRQWVTVETPESFCVFLQTSRTNNLVESHNSWFV